ncbi:hypothetical protein [Spirillospora sp. NPDC047279]|uniref:hypothetical protein n=1 Tax=Spirillospora sp. NPDC047279 TaxID=3155478 RepID=UPI0033FB49B4
MSNETPKITYYALIDDAHPVERPAGIMRRIHAEPISVDEAFTKNMEWEPTEFLRLHYLGHNEDDYVEISQSHAEAVIAGWKQGRSDQGL